MIRQTGSGAVAFTRALALIAVLVVGAPSALVAAARARFDGGSPLHGVASPADWQADRIKEALTDRLTDQTIADIVIRASLILAWAAILVLVVTTLAEVVHMLRHDGLSMPEIRGLGMPQSVARVIATGLLVVVPMFTAPSRAVARDGLLPPEQDAAASLSAGFDQTLARPDNVWVAGASVEGSTPRVPADSVRSIEAAVEGAESEPGRYVVRAGDSIYAIAGRLAGPDPASIAEFAERLIDINLDTVMPDGQRFTNAAYIDVGWVLQLPPVETGRADLDVAGQRTVERGESLWSIADDELGDGRRWPEIFDANQGRAFDDGRRLVDPDLIQPGWDLHLPGTNEPDPAAAPPASPPRRRVCCPSRERVGALVGSRDPDRRRSQGRR